MTVAMSFEQAPPIGVPFRFFLTAPLFGCVAGLLIAIFSSDVLESRWSGAALALTHLLTLGFMLQAMSGALLQVLPVAVGANVWRPGVVASVTHTGLIVGTLLLVAGFLFSAPVGFRWAVPVLSATLLFFLGCVGTSLVRTPARSPIVTVLRVSVLALAVTIGLGVSLALGFGWSLSLPTMLIAELHVGWGVLGWGLLLLVGVGFLVVPMFQLTPPYRRLFSRLFPVVLAGALLAWSLTGAAGEHLAGLRTVVAVALGLIVAGFAMETLYIQKRRRRRHADATFLFWRTGMFALLSAVALGFALVGSHDEGLRGRIELAIGLAMLMGFFVSVINGMFYKIVPFLTWLHLQNRVPLPPNMNQVIAERAMRGQLLLHWTALGALAAGLVFAPLLIAGGVLFAGSCAWLELNLARAARLYWRMSRGAASGA